MQKLLMWILIIFIASDVSGQAAYASTDHASTQIAKLKVQLDNLPTGTALKVELKDHREIEGELVAHSEEGFDLAAPESVTVSYTDVESMAEDPGGQATPGSNQYPPQHRHHGHFLRNVLIGLGACFAFALVAAVASK